MDTIVKLIRKKPRVYVYSSAGYLVVVAWFKWLSHPSFEMLWFFIGGVAGIYFLEGAEAFFSLYPSPFRSIVFQALFAVVAFFVVTSSTSMLGGGLVLTMYLQMLLWQVGEWKVVGNLHSWYRLIAGTTHKDTQSAVLVISAIVFLIETYIFIR